MLRYMSGCMEHIHYTVSISGTETGHTVHRCTVYALSRQTWVYVHRFRTVRGSFAILILEQCYTVNPATPQGFL